MNSPQVQTAPMASHRISHPSLSTSERLLGLALAAALAVVAALAWIAAGTTSEQAEHSGNQPAAVSADVARGKATHRPARSIDTPIDTPVELDRLT